MVVFFNSIDFERKFTIRGRIDSEFSESLSDNGVDDPSCVQNGSICKTLTYVLGKLSEMTFYSDTFFTVNITCNQTIQKGSSFWFSQNKFLSVRIIGQNKVYITLNSSMAITHYININNINWAWIGLVFFSGAEHTTLSILHGRLDSVTMFDCKIMTGNWGFPSVRNLVINNTEFGQLDVCPTLNISSPSWSVLFSNNIISNCSTDKSILFFYVDRVAIVNSNFTELKGMKSTRYINTTRNQKMTYFKKITNLFQLV